MFLKLKLICSFFSHVCSLFAKALKQRVTSILFGLTVLTSFYMVHASVNVWNAFEEPVIIWIASFITTGTLLLFETKRNLTFQFNQTGTIIGELISKPKPVLN